jgi:hypothetical protein
LRRELFLRNALDSIPNSLVAYNAETTWYPSGAN